MSVIVALVLNVPMSMVEQRLLLPKLKIKKGKRSLSIILALVLIIGVFVGVAFLVIPELVSAISLIVQIMTDGLEQFADLEKTGDLSHIPFSEYLSQIDWLRLKKQLEDWFKSQSGELMNHAAGSIVSAVVTSVISLVFAIYILAQKETLKRQAARMIHVWLPHRIRQAPPLSSRTVKLPFHIIIPHQHCPHISAGLGYHEHSKYRNCVRKKNYQNIESKT